MQDETKSLGNSLKDFAVVAPNIKQYTSSIIHRKLEKQIQIAQVRKLAIFLSSVLENDFDCGIKDVTNPFLWGFYGGFKQSQIRSRPNSFRRQVFHVLRKTPVKFNTKI